MSDEARVIPPLDQLSEGELRDVLRTANPVVLRIVLYQLTRDEEVRAVPVRRVPIRGGSSWDVEVPEEHREALVDKAVAYLTGERADPPPPDRDELAHLVETMAGEALPPAELAFALDELGFDEFPRGVEWPDGGAPEGLDRFHVTVVGAGVSGLAAGVYLQRLGIPYTIIDRNASHGGVWFTNSYPEARVDVSSFLYQYKFHKKYRWRDWFAPRDQVLAYLADVIDTYGLAPHMEFGVELRAATWQESSATWRLELAGPDGTVVRESNVVISAAGLFGKKALPDIPGIDDYRGKVFHTTEWDHDYDLTGKRVGLLGNGSTGTQLMPAVARQAAHLTAFQRSPNWIAHVPHYRNPIEPELTWLLRHVPYYWNWFCYAIYAVASRNQLANVVDREWQRAGGTFSELNDKLRAWFTAELRQRFADRPDLLEKLLPTYPPGAKRVILHNGWYEALKRDDVELVTEPIDRFTATGIQTSDGVERPLDAVILASGFAVSEYFWPTTYTGRNGRTLEQVWATDGARAYLGMTIPGFPNLFAFYGPNAQPRAGGFHQWAEAWAHYSVGAVVHLLTTGNSAMDCRQEVFDDYNRRVDEEFSRTVWAAGAGGYYINRFGRPGVHVPFENATYYGLIRDFNPQDYDIK